MKISIASLTVGEIWKVSSSSEVQGSSLTPISCSATSLRTSSPIMHLIPTIMSPNLLQLFQKKLWRPTWDRS